MSSKKDVSRVKKEKNINKNRSKKIIYTLVISFVLLLAVIFSTILNINVKNLSGKAVKKNISVFTKSSNVKTNINNISNGYKKVKVNNKTKYKLELVGRFRFRMGKSINGAYKHAYPQGMAVSDKYIYFSYNPVGSYTSTHVTQIARCPKSEISKDSLNGIIGNIKNCEELIDNDVINSDEITDSNIKDYIAKVEGHSQSFDVTKVSNGNDLLYVNSDKTDNGGSKSVYELGFASTNKFQLGNKIDLDTTINPSNENKQVASDNNYFAYGFYSKVNYNNQTKTFRNVEVYNKNVINQKSKPASTLVYLYVNKNTPVRAYQGIDIYNDKIYTISGLPCDSDGKCDSIDIYTFKYNNKKSSFGTNKIQVVTNARHQVLFSANYLKKKHEQGIEIEPEGLAVDEKGKIYILINYIYKDNGSVKRSSNVYLVK